MRKKKVAPKKRTLQVDSADAQIRHQIPSHFRNVCVCWADSLAMRSYV